MTTTTKGQPSSDKLLQPGVISIFTTLIAVAPIILADKIKTPVQGVLLVLAALATAAWLWRIVTLWRGGIDILLLGLTLAALAFSAIFALQTFGLPKPGKETVVSVVPDQLKGTCQEHRDEFFKSALTSVKCSSGDRAVREIHLGLFGNGAALYATYSKSVQGSKVRVNSGSDNCAKNKPGEASWEYEDLGSPGGRVFCYLDQDNDAWIEWTYDADRIYAYAYREDSNISALYKWWAAL